MGDSIGLRQMSKVLERERSTCLSGRIVMGLLIGKDVPRADYPTMCLKGKARFLLCYCTANPSCQEYQFSFSQGKKRQGEGPKLCKTINQSGFTIASSGAGGMQGWPEPLPVAPVPQETGEKLALETSHTKTANHLEPHNACYYGVKEKFSRLFVPGSHS